MANALYDNYKNVIGGAGNHGDVDLSSGGDTIRAIFIDDADHTTDTANDEDFDDLTDAGCVGESGGTGRADGAALGSQTFGTVAAGTFDAADTTFTAVSGDQVEELHLYKDSGVDTTSPLICVFDTFSSGMPLTPNGGDVDVVWNASGIIAF